MSRQKLLQAVSPIERYATAVLAVVCTLAVRLALDPMLGDRAPYMFFILAIVIVKRIWGRGPALLATALGGTSAWYFLLEPRFSFAISSRVDAFNLAGFLVVGVGVSFLGERATVPSISATSGGRNVKFRVVRQTVVLAVAAAVLAGMVLLLQHDTKRTQDAQGWVVHTYRVINSVESVLSTMNDAESGERDYLLTGDARFLAPYNAARAALPRGLKGLKDLTSDNTSQQTRLVAINRLAGQRLNELNQAIEARKLINVSSPQIRTNPGQTEQSMDELRFNLDAIMGEENNLLAVRTAEAERGAVRGHWVLGLGSAALIVLLVLASVVIERETTRREEIAQALSRHANLLEQAHDSLLTCRLRGNVDYWSRGAETLFGYTRAEAVGRPSHELLQTSHPLGMAAIDAMLERDGHWQGELTQITRDGRKLDIEAQWTLVLEADGSKTVLEANRDITGRKQAEAENLLLATAIEQADETVVITDREATIQYVNPAFTRTTGYDRLDVVGQNPRILQSGQHDAGFYRGMWETISAGKLWRGEFANRRKDASIYLEEATITPVRDFSGEIRNFIAIKADITERKQREAALRESERMLRFFVHHAPAAIAMFDQEMRYLEVSHRWLIDFHLPHRDLTGLSHYEVFPEVPHRWKEIHRRCLAGAVESCEEDSFPRQDGSTDWVRWEIRPWRKIDDSIGGIIIFSEVITERKRAEQELQRLNDELEERVRSRTAELEAANHELEAFAHSVSHDLRAPLRGIDGWSLALLEDSGDQLDAQGRKHLDRVRSEAQRMGRLIDDLLHLSRVGRGGVVFSTVDLTSLAATIFARLKEANPGRSIEFIVEPNLTGAGDARLLEIALTNLLNNAVKFTGLRTTARVELGQKEISGRPAFFVRDNGAGFDMAYAGLLFAPFQRLHKASEYSGTGIGLATVQRVIHRHGGRIWADAQVGGGATFYFTLGAEKV